MIVELQVVMTTEHEKTTATLAFADLAGSEKAKKAGGNLETVKQGAAINQQLGSLREVIKHLAANNRKKCQWRDTLLTRVMKPYIDGVNCLTMVIVCCSKREYNRQETWDTLKFGQNASNIKNFASRNTKEAHSELRSQIALLGAEKKELLQQLEDFKA